MQQSTSGSGLTENPSARASRYTHLATHRSKSRRCTQLAAQSCATANIPATAPTPGKAAGAPAAAARSACGSSVAPHSAASAASGAGDSASVRVPRHRPAPIMSAYRGSTPTVAAVNAASGATSARGGATALLARAATPPPAPPLRRVGLRAMGGLRGPPAAWQKVAVAILGARHAFRAVRAALWRGTVALEVRAPFAALLVTGAKTVETRSYALPERLVGRDLLVLATPAPRKDTGRAVASALPDALTAVSPCVVVGTVRFSRCVRYRSLYSWEQDKPRHKVADDSVWSWHNVPGPVYAWVVESATRLDTPEVPPPGLRRQLNSLFRRP